MQQPKSTMIIIFALMVSRTKLRIVHYTIVMSTQTRWSGTTSSAMTVTVVQQQLSEQLQEQQTNQQTNKQNIWALFPVCRSIFPHHICVSIFESICWLYLERVGPSEKLKQLWYRQ